jgi:polar amino acid transport system permease protein
MLEIIRDHWLLLLIGQYPEGPLGGLVATLMLAVLGLIFSFPLAVCLALATTGSIKPLKKAADLFIAVLRGVPFIMVIFWSYFVLPKATGMYFDGFTTMVIALVVYESTYLAEILRGGIEALPSGQTEAGRSLGLGYFLRARKIILPQAIRNVMPGLITQFISIIKDTSLAYIISVPELTMAATQVNLQLLTKPVQVFSLLAISYFVICTLLTALAKRIERRAKYQTSMVGA